MGFGLSKAERLSKKKEIEKLFSDPEKSLIIYPLRFLFLKNDLNFNRILVSVSKKKFKKAVERNLIKRRIKEAYRTSKIEQSNHYDMAILYIAKSTLEYKQIEKSIVLFINQEINAKAN